jgi:hypothetical protein
LALAILLETTIRIRRQRKGVFGICFSFYGRFLETRSASAAPIMIITIMIAKLDVFDFGLCEFSRILNKTQ